MRDFKQELLVRKLISPDKLEKAVSQDSSSLVYNLLSEGFVEEKPFLDFYSEYTGIKQVSLKHLKNLPDLSGLIEADILRKYFVLPLIKYKDLLTVAMADPIDQEAISNLERLTGMRINPVLAPFSEIVQELDNRYGVYTSVKNLVNSLEKPGVTDVSLGFVENEVFQSSSKAGPINKLLHLIISHALKENASDIHFEPTEKEMQCRFRIDGVLSKFLSFPKKLSTSLVSSIKVLAKMDIAEKRIPLDGGFQVKVGAKIIDLRVSSFPMIEGEKVVIRILDKSGMKFSLDGLGFSEKMLQQFLPVINRNNGIVLVTGPTGSGKTTTLYAVLEKIKSSEKNIVTIEDPIEYRLESINQAQVNIKAGLTFARGLRSFLRQDPDILLVGEIRDQETAEIAFQAALTGHLVFSTLHTNDAASSITRLRDMGIELYLLASAISAVLAQRLVRRVCQHCLEEYLPDQEILNWLGIVPDIHLKFYRGKGCEHCKFTGYKGRIGVFELLVMDNQLSELIHLPQTTAEDLKQLALSKGMLTLKDDAREKVLKGLTTAEEVYRVLR